MPEHSDIAFVLKLHRKEVPWEHQERAVYTVEALKEEMAARLRAPGAPERVNDERSTEDRIIDC